MQTHLRVRRQAAGTKFQIAGEELAASPREICPSSYQKRSTLRCAGSSPQTAVCVRLVALGLLYGTTKPNASAILCACLADCSNAFCSAFGVGVRRFC